MKFITFSVIFISGLCAQAQTPVQGTQEQALVGTWNTDSYYCGSGKKVGSRKNSTTLIYGPAPKNELTAVFVFSAGLSNPDEAKAEIAELQKLADAKTATDEDLADLATLKKVLTVGIPCTTTVNGTYVINGMKLQNNLLKTSEDVGEAICEGVKEPQEVGILARLENSGLPHAGLYTVTGEASDTIEFDITSDYADPAGQAIIAKTCGNPSDHLIFKLRRATAAKASIMSPPVSSYNSSLRLPQVNTSPLKVNF